MALAATELDSTPRRPAPGRAAGVRSPDPARASFAPVVPRDDGPGRPRTMSVSRMTADAARAGKPVPGPSGAHAGVLEVQAKASAASGPASDAAPASPAPAGDAADGASSGGAIASEGRTPSDGKTLPATDAGSDWASAQGGSAQTQAGPGSATPESAAAATSDEARSEATTGSEDETAAAAAAVPAGPSPNPPLTMVIQPGLVPPPPPAAVQQATAAGAAQGQAQAVAPPTGTIATTAMPTGPVRGAGADGQGQATKAALETGEAEARTEFAVSGGDNPATALTAAFTPSGVAADAPAASAQAPAAGSSAQTAAAPIPLGAVPMTIGLRSLAGSNHFEIRLDPKELGRIDVNLDIDKDLGTVKAHLVVDRPETLALLQRDAGSLQQALAQAGLDAGDGSINLSLRSDAQSSGQGSDGRRSDTPSPGGRPGFSDPSDPRSAPDAVPLIALRGLGGIDIRI